ncbi:MAG: hypothetical protein Q9226_004186 [Calogaya cf. arnoldii]
MPFGSYSGSARGRKLRREILLFGACPAIRLIIGAGPAGLMAALWMARCGIKTRVIDKRDAGVRAGHADGIQCRTLEILESFGIVDRIWKESCHMPEMCMWSDQNPGYDGLIHRSSRMSNTIPAISRFPCGVLLAQHRIEAVLLEEINKHPNVTIQRGVEPIDIEINSCQTGQPMSHAVTVKLKQTPRDDGNHVVNGVGKGLARKRNRVHADHSQFSQETIHARYVIGCDGAHSWTRTQLGFLMEGEQTEYIWGVLADIRSRCAIHSAESGTIMIIPREDGLVRIYCQLSTVAPGSDGRFDRSRITPDFILEAAQRIIRPYKLEYKYRDWWTVYQIGQRVGNHFSAAERIFLAGDAIHTHSPKAGQGMNVSIQDTYNLGWKLAMVVKGIAKPSILKTYETERRAVARELIAFDQEYSRLWSSRPKKSTQDTNGLSMAAFERAFVQQQLFASGFGVHYRPNPLIACDSSSTNGITNHPVAVRGASLSKGDFASSNQHLATKTILGQRFPSFKVINHSDARCWHLANWLKSAGNFHILLFAGDVSQPSQMDRVRTFAGEMSRRSDTIPLQRRQIPKHHSHPCSNQSPQDPGGIARLLTIHSAPRQRVEIHDFPPLLLPYDDELGYDYDCIFVDGESYYEGHGRAYEGYGIDPERGCVVLLRPDQHVAWIGEVEEVAGLEAYFERILVGI